MKENLHKTPMSSEINIRSRKVCKPTSIIHDVPSIFEYSRRSVQLLCEFCILVNGWNFEHVLRTCTLYYWNKRHICYHLTVLFNWIHFTLSILLMWMMFVYVLSYVISFSWHIPFLPIKNKFWIALYSVNEYLGSYIIAMQYPSLISRICEYH